MRKSKLTEEQIAYTIRQVEQGTPATELCRKLGISPRRCHLVPNSRRRATASFNSTFARRAAT